MWFYYGLFLVIDVIFCRNNIQSRRLSINQKNRRGCSLYRSFKLVRSKEEKYGLKSYARCFFFPKVRRFVTGLKSMGWYSRTIPIWPNCFDFAFSILSIGTRSSMDICLGSRWRCIDTSNGLLAYVRLSRGLFSYSNRIE